MKIVLKVVASILCMMMLSLNIQENVSAAEGGTKTTVDRYQYGDNYLTGKTTPNAIVAFADWGVPANWKSKYMHYATADSNGNFKLFSSNFSSGQTIELDTYDQNGTKLSSNKVYVFKESFTSLDPIYDTSQELTGKTVKNTKVEVMKDGEVIASGTFNDAIHLKLPVLNAGTFLTVKMTTGSNIDVYKKLLILIKSHLFLRQNGLNQ